MIEKALGAFAWIKARLATIAIVIAATAVLCLLSYCQGRSDGRAAIEAEQAKAAIEGTNRADADEHGRREAAQNRADANEGAIRNAVRDHPEETNRAAGPATGAVLNELRRQRR